VVFKVIGTRAIQTVNDGSRMGIGSDNIGFGMMEPALGSVRDRHVKDTVLVTGDSRCGDVCEGKKGEEQEGLVLLVLEDEQMISCHPRIPSFIYLSPTRTYHSNLPSVSLTTQWHHFSPFPHWLFPHFSVFLCHGFSITDILSNQFLSCNSNRVFQSSVLMVESEA